jgi:hypothetical protein
MPSTAADCRVLELPQLRIKLTLNKKPGSLSTPGFLGCLSHPLSKLENLFFPVVSDHGAAVLALGALVAVNKFDDGH